MSEEGIQQYYKALCTLFNCPSVYKLNVTFEELYNFDQCWFNLTSPPQNGMSEQQRTTAWMEVLCVQSLNVDVHNIPYEYWETHPSLKLQDYKVFHYHRLLTHVALPHLAYLHWVLLSFCIIYRKEEFRQANGMKLNDWFLHVVIFGDNERFATLKTSVRDYFTLVYYHYSTK